MYLTLVVDDMLFISPDEELTLRTLRSVLDVFKGTHSGEAAYYNGIRISRMPSSRILLTQAAHIDKIRAAFEHVADLTIKHNLPLPTGIRLHKNGTNKVAESPPLDTSRFHYRELIGSLNYVACGTRPDIAFAVNQLARYSNAPTHAHWELAIHCLQYLVHTKYWGVLLGSGAPVHKVYSRHLPDQFPPSPHAAGYADAKHGTGIDDKRSISGTLLQVLGGHVSWSARVQPVVALSTTDSEIRALSEVCREALWVAKLIDLVGLQSKPLLIRGDSKSAIDSITNYKETARTRHLEIHHGFMQDRYKNGDLDFEHVPGSANVADVFTKALPFPAFARCRRDMGMCELPVHMW